MTSVVSICNQALTHLGEERISDLSEDTPQAQVCQANYDEARDGLLAEHPWNFAIRRANVAALTDVPAWGGGAYYQLPTDSLRVLEVVGAGVSPDGPQWRVESDRRIWSDAGAPLSVLYVARVDDPAAMPAYFRELLSARLALKIAPSVTRSPSLIEAAQRAHDGRLRKAKSIDAQESGMRTLTADRWIAARA